MVSLREYYEKNGEALPGKKVRFWTSSVFVFGFSFFSFLLAFSFGVGEEKERRLVPSFASAWLSVGVD